MVAWRYEFYLLVLKNVSLVRAIYNNRTANGKNKKLTGIHKAPCSGLYSGTCSKMISSYISSLLVYLCMLVIIKYTPMIMMYRGPPKLSEDKQAVSQCYKEKLLQANPQKYQILTIDATKPLGMCDDRIRWT